MAFRFIRCRDIVRSNSAHGGRTEGVYGHTRQWNAHRQTLSKTHCGFRNCARFPTERVYFRRTVLARLTLLYLKDIGVQTAQYLEC